MNNDAEGDALHASLMNILTQNLNESNSNTTVRQPQTAAAANNRPHPPSPSAEPLSSSPLFQGIGGGIGIGCSGRSGEPRTDVLCNASEYAIFMDLPGVDRNKLVVQVREGAIHVSAEALRPPLLPPYQTCISERPSSNRSSRSVVLHPDADLEGGVEAHFGDGLLFMRVKRHGQYAFLQARRRHSEGGGGNVIVSGVLPGSYRRPSSVPEQEHEPDDSPTVSASAVRGRRTRTRREGGGRREVA